jgi:hypothetical protein
MFNIANCNDRQCDNQQGIKYFKSVANQYANWIFKTNGTNKLITPENKLNSISIPQDLYIGNNLYVENNIFNLSDLNKKINITDLSLTDDTLRLFELKPKTYNYLPTQEDELPTLSLQKHFGLIAQEVELIFPELVDDTILGCKNINYIELIPLMLCKMKQMQVEINNLKLKKYNNII